MKVGITFSAGGHYLEAMKACELVMADADNEIFFVTYKQLKKADLKIPCYFVTHPKHGFILKRIFLFISNFIGSFIIYLKQKPDLIISSGADVTLSIMLIAKMFGNKVIFLESGANVTKPSLTGRLIYRFADVFIIQWPELKTYYPKAILGINLL